MNTSNSGAGQETSSRRTLYLMRHAAAEFGAVSDHARPLSVAGRREAHAVGGALAAREMIPKLLVCSSALRTRTTADLLKSKWLELGLEVPLEILDELYSAHPRAVIEFVQQLDPAHSSVLIIGHEPTMSMLTATLAGPESNSSALHVAQVGFVTAAVGVIEIGGAWGSVAPKGGILKEVAPPPSDAG